MKPVLIATLLFLALCPSPSQAEPLPFDMSPERPQANAEQSASDGGSGGASVGAPSTTKKVERLEEVLTPHPAARADTKQLDRRYLLPSGELTLDGETDQKNWSLFLTSWQANNAKSLTLSYRNTVVIAPENSTMTVSINDHMVISEPLRSPAGFTKLSVDLPKELLRYGANTISIRVDQHHRTDCTIESTYELATTLNGPTSYLSFAGEEQIPDLEAVRAVGADGNGTTHFAISSPSIKQANAAADLLSLSQALALLSGMPNQSVSFNRDTLPASGPGLLGVLVGTAADLAPILPNLPQAARMGQVATMVKPDADQAPILLISGPDWNAVSAAIEKIVTPLGDPSLDQRSGVQANGWLGPDMPTVLSETQFSLADLGLKTEEFGGRRFKTTFSLMLPGDFYGSASSEFKLLLDAAYSPDVLPGNHITVFVNGEVASVVQINNRHGGIFKHYPVSVTMRHFKPGRNTITLSAELETSEDAVCAPVGIPTHDARFALFSTTEIEFPHFARIGQFPNLKATAQTGFPYSKEKQNLSLFIEPVGPETLSTAATALGKLALASGHPIGIETKTSLRAIGEEDTIFVAPISQIPRSFLDRFHIAPDAIESWNQIDGKEEETADTTKQFDEWQSRISNQGILGYLERLGNWLHQKFGLSTEELNLFKDISQPFQPTPDETVLIAQGTSFEGNGSWTLITASTTQNLAQGSDLLSLQSRWTGLQGYLTSLAPDQTVVRLDPNPSLHLSDPWDLRNLRLVITDWLSRNSLVYVGLLLFAAIFLALTWSSLLRRSGRRE